MNYVRPSLSQNIYTILTQSHPHCVCFWSWLVYPPGHRAL